MKQSLEDIRGLTAMLLWDLRKAYHTKNIRKFRDADRRMYGFFMVGLISDGCYRRICEMRYELGL